MITKCFNCDLCSTRKRIVAGYGIHSSSIMFIGNSPGYQEDKHGVPFVGNSGRELQKYLDLCNFSREEIYITNAIKCKIPKGRTPTFYEMVACRPNLHKEFITIKPKIVVFLGYTAIATFFNPYYSFSSVLNRSFKLGTTIFMLLNHPNYIRFNPDKAPAYIKKFKTIGRVYQYYNNNHTLNY